MWWKERIGFTHKAVTAFHRFTFFSRMMQFDNSSSRNLCWIHVKFPAFRKFFETIKNQFIKLQHQLAGFTNISRWSVFPTLRIELIVINSCIFIRKESVYLSSDMANFSLLLFTVVYFLLYIVQFGP